MVRRLLQGIAVIAFLLSGSNSWAQSQTPLDIALRHIEQHYKTWNLSETDIKDMVVSDQYTNRNNGTTYLYFNQRHTGIKMHNAIINLSIMEDGRIASAGKRFVPNLAERVSTPTATLSADEAMVIIGEALGINTTIPRPTILEVGKKYNYPSGYISNQDVSAELLYKTIGGEIMLVWYVEITPLNTSGNWSFTVDASTGIILEKRDLVLRCTFSDRPFHRHGADCAASNITTAKPIREALIEGNMAAAMSGSYRAFAFPTMSPNNGSHVLVTSPHDPTASPFGWHDINGVAGAEFTTTRGNNTRAFLDRDGNGFSDGPEPDGGMTLNFDFPFDPDLEPEDNADASVTNLFYMTNMVHDIAYAHGFDEAAGNFQINNYGNGGEGGDAITARAQASAVAGMPQVNNATYTGGSDGSFGIVSMFVWDESYAITGLLNITEPEIVAGQYNTGMAEFGPLVSNIPITGEVIEVNDNVYDPYITDACEDFSDLLDLTGKIALVDRGGCVFEQKTVYAEAAGAIAVILCNFEDDPLTLGGRAEIPDPGIPTISIGAIDCATFRQFAGNGLEVTIVQPEEGIGPENIDGDFDNGIIVHEYAHGISNRLTGGPSTSSCLFGIDTDDDGEADDGEQMGEGWSDFFSLAMSVKAGDTGEMKRGIGTYIQRQGINTTGIRTFPYSTDRNINPHTYANISNESYPHGVGSVWCVILWDLYWAMVDEYGFDEDQFNGDGGNNRALKLVIEGMKIQPCSPGFVDGRDAILNADMNLFGGANQCLIWDVFAQRGVGINADQGSTLTRTDQVESFASLPTCIAELKISKAVTAIINAGENIETSIEVINHKPETLTDVLVTETLTDGTAYLSGSCSLGDAAVNINGNVITFAIDTMEYLDELRFTYELTTVEDKFSIRHFYEDVEQADFDFWFTIPVENENFWQVSTENQYTGESAWFIENVAMESQQILQGGQPSEQISVDGDNPVLRFYHNYNTEASVDGGAVEISTDGGVFWKQLGEDMFRGLYPGFIQYTTFVIPNFSAFHGDSNGWIATYIDLTEYAGQDIILRWNFASDDNTAPSNGGWYVDDIEIMDLVNYNSEVCVRAEEGDEACATADGRGTVVESQLPTSVNGFISKNIAMTLFPNPASEQLNLSITSADNQNVILSIMTLDGREVLAKSIQTSTMTQTFSMNVSELAAGFYFVKASTNVGIVVEKVIIH